MIMDIMIKHTIICIKDLFCNYPGHIYKIIQILESRRKRLFILFPDYQWIYYLFISSVAGAARILPPYPLQLIKGSQRIWEAPPLYSLLRKDKAQRGRGV